MHVRPPIFFQRGRIFLEDCRSYTYGLYLRLELSLPEAEYVFPSEPISFSLTRLPVKYVFAIFPKKLFTWLKAYLDLSFPQDVFTCHF